MLPLEVVFFMLVAMWGLIGIVRGFSSEIGASIAIVLAMAVLRVFGPTTIGVVNKFAGKLTSYHIPVAASVPAGTNPFCAATSPEQFTFYTVMFAAIVFMGYQGETFGLPIKLSRAPGLIFGLFAGMLNGWLIAGNLWYFLDKCANYSVPTLGIQNVGVLSQTAQTILKVLPMNLIGEPLLLMGIMFLLLIARIAK